MNPYRQSSPVEPSAPAAVLDDSDRSRAQFALGAQVTSTAYSGKMSNRFSGKVIAVIPARPEALYLVDGQRGREPGRELFLESDLTASARDTL